MKWNYDLPNISGTYLVETTTFMGKHNVMRARFVIIGDKPSWSFKNQVFWRYLEE